MLRLQTELEGKRACYGHVRDTFTSLGYDLGGNWDYDKGCFDAILWKQESVTIYIRLLFQVMKGELDQYDAIIQFQTPFVIKHVINIGLEADEHSLLTASELNQFQDPVDPDDKIENKNKWELAGEKAVQKVIQSVHGALIAS